MNRDSVKLVISLLVLMSMLLAACGATAEPTAAPQPTEAEPAAPPAAETPEKLRVWITWGDDPEQIQELFNRYTEISGIPVEVNSPVEDEKVVAALSGSEPPDVLVLGGPEPVSTWVNEGLVAPLDDIAAANNLDLEDIYPAMRAQGFLDGKYYALPWGTDTYALYWNKDLFEEAGLDPEKPPETMSEFAEYADKLTKVEADGSISQIGFVPNFSWSHLEQYVSMFGGYFVSEDGTKFLLDTQPVIDALKWEQEFYNKYDPEEVIRFTSSLGDYDGAEHGFISGKVAMMVDGEWFVGDNFIGAYNPDLWYGVAPLPYPDDHPERAGTNLVAGTVALIPSGVKNLEESGKLFAWMMSPEIVADEMVFNFNLPSSKTAAEDPRFAENEKFVKFMELAAGPNTKHHIFNSVSGEMFTELELLEEEVLYTGADPVPLLQEAQEKLQTMLDDALNQ